MGNSVSKKVNVQKTETVHIRNGISPIKFGNGLDADGRSIYSDKPSDRTYNIPIKKQRFNL